MSDFSIFGWRVKSDIPLPELGPWRGDARAPDIVIALGSVSALDPDKPRFNPAIQITPAAVCVDIPSVARFWVASGQFVTIQPAMPVNFPDIRGFLFATILAVLCFQRGVLPLHASAVEIDGRALLLTGNSGAGKSTLAAALVDRGFRVLSDDLCALEIADGRLPTIHPAFARVKLWRDSAAYLQKPTTNVERGVKEFEKLNIPVADASFHSEPLPPAKVIFLRAQGKKVGNEPRILRGLEALRRFDLVHRWRLGLALGQQALMFKAMARLIETVPVAEVFRSDDLEDLPNLVDTVLALVGAQQR